MSQEPVISIIIPCYNQGEYIEDALKSVEESKRKYPVEIIIVNDGSTDRDTLQALKKVEEEGYFVLHQKNQGLGNARNNGIRIAKSKYILPLDSDNKVRPPYLNEAIERFEKDKEIDIIYGDAQNFGERNNVLKNKELDKFVMLTNNYIDACAVYRKEVWEKVNGYAEDMPFMGCEDWNFWLKCIDKGFKFYYLNNICFDYRVLSNSMSRSVPKDFYIKTLVYNFNNLPELYIKAMDNKDRKTTTILKNKIKSRGLSFLVEQIGRKEWLKAKELFEMMYFQDNFRKLRFLKTLVGFSLLKKKIKFNYKTLIFLTKV